MKAAPILFGIAAGAYLLSEDISGYLPGLSETITNNPLDLSIVSGYSSPIDYSVSDSFLPLYSESINMQVSDDTKSVNLNAFLKLIRQRESEDDYSKLVGGGHFNSFNDHPYLSGEFKGIKRSDGRLTTAAGAYQITKTTWIDIGGIGRFGSFKPDAQDAAAIYLIKRRGAIGAIERGDVITARTLLKNEWEFLVTSRGNDEQVAKLFTLNGGELA